MEERPKNDGGNFLITFLTILLVITGVAEAGFLGYIGYTTVSSRRADQQITQQQSDAQTQQTSSDTLYQQSAWLVNKAARADRLGPVAAASSRQSGGSGSWGEERTTSEITAALSRTTYWTRNGKSYHFSSNCPPLARSKKIITGTLQGAIYSGHTDPCNNCANGS